MTLLNNRKGGKIMRHMAVIFALCLLVMSARAGTFRDDFEDGNLDGWGKVLNLGGGISEWKVEDGVLICRRPSDPSTFLLFGEKDWKNYSIEFDARMVEVLSNWHSIGMDLRLQDVSNGVWVAISGGVNTANIVVWANNNFAEQETKPFAFELNRWYRLKGVANDDTFEFYVDGELMVSLSDSHFPTGYVDLDTNGCLAHFDNVVITGDDVPDNSAAVWYSGKLAVTWGQIRSQQD
jgi:hypothetical protein